VVMGVKANPHAGQQALARDLISLLICKTFVELRGFEPLTGLRRVPELPRFA
jgi:hypothetical protein